MDQLEGRFLLSANVLVNDLMVVGYSSDNDTVALMATVNIPNGETVFLTDRGFNVGTGALRAGSTFETTVTWVTVNNITAGTIIHISGPTAASFVGTAYGTLSGAFTFDGTSGDQLLIFQTADDNSESTPVFVSAFNGDRPTDRSSLDRQPISRSTCRGVRALSMHGAISTVTATGMNRANNC